MGTVVTFPESRRTAREAVGAQNASATIIILPVIRIEHYSDEPDDDYSTGPTLPGRRRRRRTTRT